MSREDSGIALNRVSRYANQPSQEVRHAEMKGPSRLAKGRLLRALSPLLICVGVWSISPAQAGTVTIDPNSFATGTDISTATPGVTLDYLQLMPNAPNFSPAILGQIYSVSCPSGTTDGFTCVQPSGSHVFGHTAGPGQPDFAFYSYQGSGCHSGFGGTYIPNGGVTGCDIAAFRADFTTTTDSVSVIAPNCGSGGCDQVVLAAYDSSFNEIGLCALGFNSCGTLVSPGVYDLKVNTGASPIAHVVVDGAFQGIDKFSFNTKAPEIDTASAASGLTLLLGSLIVLRGRRAKLYGLTRRP